MPQQQPPPVQHLHEELLKLGQILYATSHSLGFAHGELWRPRPMPNGTAVLELVCTSIDGAQPGEPGAESLRNFVKNSAILRFAAGYGLPGRVWTSQQPELTFDLIKVPKHEFMRGDLAISNGLVSALGIPIATLGGETLAVGVFFSSSDTEPSVEKMSSLGAAMRMLADAVAELEPLAPSEVGHTLQKQS